MSVERMLSPKEVAEELSITVQTVYSYADRGLLKPDYERISGGAGKHTVREWKQSTVNAFKKKYAVGVYNGETLVGVGDVCLYLDIPIWKLNDYVKKGLLTPDVVLPGGSYRTGRRLFKESKVKAFASELKSQKSDTEDKQDA